ncbi:MULTISPECIES: DNA recombination protein RmuC [unclassified Caballeronia]|uniref:DNA recombination protein RmuC n=1 Tax=unclassified Caballeronia TaxID=2646786 RepID=UPI00285951E3|nr:MULTISPECIES: DNA recombination protein RmuC [unclassified Caballeronia]MDR5820632.1 DNA recombination protein RmuC [Caballeronia sp. LZ043]MDR5878586.1 DNA recombination protein RmuC [Caballeronia sp. LZ032]
MMELLVGAVAVLALALVIALIALVVTLRRPSHGGMHDEFEALTDRVNDMGEAHARAQERLERGLRGDIAESGRVSRMEAQSGFAQFHQTLSTQLASTANVQNAQFDALAQQLAQQSQQAREDQGNALKRFADSISLHLAQLSEANERRLGEVRATLEARLKDIEANNATKLDEMRRTVDEKLHATLEQRLGESFKLVSDRLEQVHRGLGEMQTLAAGVGDLKKVLTNVKTRGTWGEVQLEALLEQLLTPEQYAKNVATVPKSNERVEFAIKLPGRHDAPGASSTSDEAATPVWLPIDAKFPREDYERLIDAQERADPAAVEDAARALEGRLRAEAKAIAQKYVAPPHTTDFALLFLPTEGLYAEALRRPGLSDALQRDYRVSIAGPTTLTALLNSLQMGFRTLAIEKRSSEVWQVLGAVKTEFGKFGDVLARTKSQLETVTRSIEAAQTRTRQMNKRLRDVEALPGERAAGLLGEASGDAPPPEGEEDE